MKFAIVLGGVGFVLSKILFFLIFWGKSLTNTFFVKKSSSEERKEFFDIEDDNKLKEYNWMTKLIKNKPENNKI